MKQSFEKLVELTDVTIFVNKEDNAVIKKHNQNTTLANKEVSYILSNEDMALLNEFARLYQLATCGLSEEDWEFLIETYGVIYEGTDENFIMTDAENYILERLL